MIDVGVNRGFQNLYKKEMFLDYTIEVEEKEYKVHKAVLAAISDYFQVMFSGSLMESKTDRVVLEGLTAQSVSKLIELIYTGNEHILTTHVDDILSCAVYFQMGTIIDVCIQKLLNDLNIKNCLDILSKLSLYSLQDKAQKVKDFIKSNWCSVVLYCKHKEMPEDLLRFIIDKWNSLDWELFLFIKEWYKSDSENRKVLVNDLMSHVRFSIMTPGQLTAIKDMDIFTACEGSWRHLVDAAVKYHKQPVNLQVLDTSVKIKPGTKARHVFFTTGNRVPSTTLYVEEDGWEKYTTQNAPTLREVVNVIEVNNFLIVCCAGEGRLRPQNWYIFSPHSLTWSPMDFNSFYLPRTGFALVHYRDYLYRLGGSYCIDTISDHAERFSLETKKWESVMNMSEPVTNHSACVLGDRIYVCGGRRQKRGGYFSGSGKLECCHVQTGVWERKAPLPKPKENHQMHVMMLRNEKAIVVIDQRFDVDYYSPGMNQWTMYGIYFNDDPYSLEWGPASTMMCRGNCVYFLNISRSLDESSDEEEDVPVYSYRCQSYCHYPCCGYHSCHEQYSEEGICWKWTFPEDGKEIDEMKLSDFPIHERNQKDMKPFGAMLLIK